MRHWHVPVLSWLLQMQTGLDRCVHGRMRASNRFRDGRATITRLARQKETKHRGICVRNFSCNPINGGSRSGRGQRTAEEPLPFYGSLASGRADPPVSLYTNGPHFVHCLHVPLRKCAVWIPPTSVLQDVFYGRGCTVQQGDSRRA